MAWDSVLQSFRGAKVVGGRPYLWSSAATAPFLSEVATEAADVVLVRTTPRLVQVFRDGALVASLWCSHDVVQCVPFFEVEPSSTPSKKRRVDGAKLPARTNTIHKVCCLLSGGQLEYAVIPQGPTRDPSEGRTPVLKAQPCAVFTQQPSLLVSAPDAVLVMGYSVVDKDKDMDKVTPMGSHNQRLVVQPLDTTATSLSSPLQTIVHGELALQRVTSAPLFCSRPHGDHDGHTSTVTRLTKALYEHCVQNEGGAPKANSFVCVGDRDGLVHTFPYHTGRDHVRSTIIADIQEPVLAVLPATLGRSSANGGSGGTSGLMLVVGVLGGSSHGRGKMREPFDTLLIVGMLGRIHIVCFGSGVTARQSTFTVMGPIHSACVVGEVLVYTSSGSTMAVDLAGASRDGASSDMQTSFLPKALPLPRTVCAVTSVLCRGREALMTVQRNGRMLWAAMPKDRDTLNTATRSVAGFSFDKRIHHLLRSIGKVSQKNEEVTQAIEMCTERTANINRILHLLRSSQQSHRKGRRAALFSSLSLGHGEVQCSLRQPRSQGDMSLVIRHVNSGGGGSDFRFGRGWYYTVSVGDSAHLTLCGELGYLTWGKERCIVIPSHWSIAMDQIVHVHLCYVLENDSSDRADRSPMKVSVLVARMRLNVLHFTHRTDASVLPLSRSSNALMDANVTALGVSRLPCMLERCLTNILPRTKQKTSTASRAPVTLKLRWIARGDLCRASRMDSLLFNGTTNDVDVVPDGRDRSPIKVTFRTETASSQAGRNENTVVIRIRCHRPSYAALRSAVVAQLLEWDGVVDEAQSPPSPTVTDALVRGTHTAWKDIQTAHNNVDKLAQALSTAPLLLSSSVLESVRGAYFRWREATADHIVMN